MTTETPVIQKDKGRWFFFFAKLFFFLMVLLAVIIAILSALGGKSDVLKTSVEEFMGARFGGKGSVETLNQMTFFPYMGADFEGLKITRRDNESQVLMSAERIVVAMGFWDVMFSANKVKAFNIENLYAVPGVVMERGITISRLAIIDEGDEAFVRGQGKIGSNPFTIEAPIKKYGAGSKRKYGFDTSRLISGTFGDITFSGVMVNPDPDTMSITDIKIDQAGKAQLTGQLDLYYGGEYRLTIKGDLAMASGSHVKPDILLELGGDQPMISGSLNFLPLAHADFANYRDFITLYDTLKSALGQSNAKAFKGNLVIASGNTEFPAAELSQAVGGEGFPATGNIMLNCVLADIALDNGIADISSFVIQAPQSSVTGTGHYVFDTDVLTLQNDNKAGAPDTLITALSQKADLANDHPCRAKALPAE